MTPDLPRPGEYLVMPYEDPHTYGDLAAAQELVAEIVELQGCDPRQVQIYRLVPVA